MGSSCLGLPGTDQNALLKPSGISALKGQSHKILYFILGPLVLICTYLLSVWPLMVFTLFFNINFEHISLKKLSDSCSFSVKPPVPSWKGLWKLLLATWMVFRKPLQTAYKNLRQTFYCSSFRKPIHVATCGFRKPFHDGASGIRYPFTQ